MAPFKDNHAERLLMDVCLNVCLDVMLTVSGCVSGCDGVWSVIVTAVHLTRLCYQTGLYHVLVAISSESCVFWSGQTSTVAVCAFSLSLMKRYNSVT